MIQNEWFQNSGKGQEMVLFHESIKVLNIMGYWN